MSAAGKEAVHGLDRLPIQRLAAFSSGGSGGNPAGVVLLEALPPSHEMQAVAARIGYSETVFGAPEQDGWRVRYFAPEAEVAFCGHATIALGAALAARLGAQVFRLRLNDAAITVDGWERGGTMLAALVSPRATSRPASPELTEDALRLFSLDAADLDPRIPPAVTDAGAPHLVLALRERERLAALTYDFDAGRALALRAAICTFNIVQAEGSRRFHARNPFPYGGVYEDPATGAAAAALGGYLRRIGWPHGGGIEVLQGEDMGQPSRLHVAIGPNQAQGVRVSGEVRWLAEPDAA
ncbi:PhzF family phenazine biosynthesis protein [Falsiroseomonas sp. HW251]|uniref:PhzF family phenazine biosynthesis protein n=1 Tax=Falsiroseomonas sp. HW251 TaxID=3390998 RepID=UPI003D30F3B7